MQYKSTRGKAEILDFEGVVCAGLASDGGLYVPSSWPEFSAAEIASMRGLPYHELAVKVLEPLVGGSIDKGELARMTKEAYGTFRHPAIAPLKQLSGNVWLLELFHGPTLAFKDFALQLLGRLLEYALVKRNEQVTVIGATSGDTGSAAIEGCRGRKNMRIAILHPKGRVSEVQRRQMTTVMDANVKNIAVEGSFDDCQAMVKRLFADNDFRKKHNLAAVNSINWARIAAQIVYYFYAAVNLGVPFRQVAFSVPTGNFGDVYAGYVASKMGLPVKHLVVATNRNDILTRFMDSGSYKAGDVFPTMAPSMDIQVSSNFERLLFDSLHDDSNALCGLMDEFQANGSLTPPAASWRQIRAIFSGRRVEENEILNTIKQVYSNTSEVLDPHTAIGVAAADCGLPTEIPVVCLATASPAKFPDAVKKACGVNPTLPEHMSDLLDRPERYSVAANNIDAIKQEIEKF